jgi:hypothetical protein
VSGPLAHRLVASASGQPASHCAGINWLVPSQTGRHPSAMSSSQLTARASSGAPVPDKQGVGWLPEDDYVKHFAADVNPAQAKVMHAVQQPLAGSQQNKDERPGGRRLTDTLARL